MRGACVLLAAVLAGLALLLPDRAGPAPLTGVVPGGAGARVRYQATDIATRADAAGRFALPPSAAGRRVTAWLEGHFIAGAPARGSPVLALRPLPAVDHEEYAWIDPTPRPGQAGRCGNCHAPIHQEWAASGHARAATGKHFRGLYDGTDWHGGKAGWGLLAEHPDGAGVCSSCHAPTVRDNDPALFDLRQVQGVAAHGVHCDYCHKITGLGDGEIGLEHGRFLHTLLRPASGQLNFGPLDDVDRGEESFSPFYRDSRYCAACHEGVVFGVRVYSTYTEWLRSPARQAGQHCQHCHMKPTGRLTNIAPGRGGVERDPLTLGNHTFWDGSQQEMLRRCLTLDVSWRGDTAEVRLTARGVGHAVPTGFIDRQLILAVEAFDARGRAVPRKAGPTLPPAVGAPLAGEPGWLYARLLRDADGRSPVPFWRALPDPVDTRLVPDTPDVRRFTFAAGAARLRVRVLHRCFWAEQIRAKGWPDSDISVIDRTFSR